MKTEKELIAEYAGLIYSAYIGNQDMVNSIYKLTVEALQTTDAKAIGNEVTASICVMAVGQAEALARTVLAAIK